MAATITARHEAEIAQLEQMMGAALDYQIALRRKVRSSSQRNRLLADQAWLDLLTAMNAVDGIDDALAEHIDIAREEVERNDPDNQYGEQAA
jgi:hypothetical protein